jgi:L-histidine Nalpha-methyltransferase
MTTKDKIEQLEIQFLRDIKMANNTEVKEGADIKDGLTQNPKTLPAKYFYDQRGSQLFELICDLPEYYPTRTEAEILHRYAEEISQITGACELVELGSGSSTKTRLLLDAYQAQKYDYQYVPIDVSESILKDSTIQLKSEYPDLKIRALVGTYEQALEQLNPTVLPARMIFFLGSSLGNFTPEECDRFFDQIVNVLQKGDYFLLGIDLQKPIEILTAAYNDSQGVTADFNVNMLSHLNWRFQGNFDTSLFTHEAIYNQEQNQIEMYLHCQKSHVVNLKSLDLTINFQQGESLLTEISRKFDLKSMQTELQSKGLQIVKVFIDDQQWFGLILCQAI